jgi:hypothetical protein
MAKTKSKPGPKPKYGEREEIHVLVPVDDLNYIRSTTNNVTEWIIQAIQAKRQAEEQKPDASPESDNLVSGRTGKTYRRSYTQIDRERMQKAAESVLSEEFTGSVADIDLANELALRRGMTGNGFIQEYMRAVPTVTRREATNALSTIEQSYGAVIGSDQMRLTAYKAVMRSSTSYGGDTPDELNASLQRLVQDSVDMVSDGLVMAEEANSAIKFKTSSIVHTKP